ncbi:MAG: hypothetical protein JRN24_00290, partial [Nitrososphaerota archaeon]|nr:hypothetical protein [Nitrososphaerota archaeon]
FEVTARRPSGRPRADDGLGPLGAHGPFGRIEARVTRRVLSRNLTGPATFLDPDELRRLPDGTLIPVEIKSCRSPRSGVPYPSHRVQLLAYCALVEETYGRAPPYGVVAYEDGRELRLAWDAGAKLELRGVLRNQSERSH